MMLVILSGVTSVDQVMCVCVFSVIPSRHSGDSAPWWQEDKTV